MLMVCIVAASGFSDEVYNAFETVILETFDHGDQAQYDWKVEGSKFTAKTDSVTYPMVTYAPEWPSALFKSADGKDQDGNDLNSLGIKGAFNRKGYNWIDVYPTLIADDEATGKSAGDIVEIPMPGRTNIIGMWVWGSNLDYYLEVYIRDYQGSIHTIKMGDLNYTGWKKLTGTVPSTIPQAKKMLPRLESLHLVKFRIWTTPREQVSDFAVYFDNLTVLTDLFESIYDGNTLADPVRRAEIWDGGAGE
jgi:hypothetical protein